MVATKSSLLSLGTRPYKHQVEHPHPHNEGRWKG